MVTLFVTLLSITGGLTYFGMMGFSYQKMLSIAKGNCRDCSSNWKCYTDHAVGAFFGGLFWPIGWAMVLGIVNGRAGSRTERRQTKALADAEHRVELARLQAQEAAYLDRALRG